MLTFHDVADLQLSIDHGSRRQGRRFAGVGSTGGESLGGAGPPLPEKELYR